MLLPPFHYVNLTRKQTIVNARPMQIVIIGGNSFTLTDEAVREIQKAGWGVSYAKNHDEIKKALKQESRILAIIIDNDLPVFSFPIQKIQQFEMPSPKPLLILTAQKDHLVALAHALHSGFDEFLAKPISEEEILTLLDKHLTICG